MEMLRSAVSKKVASVRMLRVMRRRPESKTGLLLLLLLLSSMAVSTSGEVRALRGGSSAAMTVRRLYISSYHPSPSSIPPSLSSTSTSFLSSPLPPSPAPLVLFPYPHTTWHA
eukprot:754019-Hanusia_phi.AAC.3